MRSLIKTGRGRQSAEQREFAEEVRALAGAEAETVELADAGGLARVSVYGANCPFEGYGS